ncbi:hypothetical protein [Treponema pectinovorum]|uniref:hypothetical protein n=1 Tax=Treponema pectinovorum TaxID=164 RepID=UPI0011CB68B2|nr:hypothetical protein [Treponema pectinovorum]
MSLKMDDEPMREVELESSFNYNFSENETALLAKFLRKNQNQLPEGLEAFARKLELFIYSNMSIDEVEKFYL